MIKEFSNNIIELSQVSSTNDYCKLNMASLKNGDIIFSLCQTAGKGTGGKTWETKPGECLAFSIVLKQTSLGELTILPLLCGLVVSLTLEELTNKTVAIKWPNDVIIGKRKICGILCESSISGNNIDTVCGIGINILQTIGRFKEQNLPHATSLYNETGQIFQGKQIVACFLKHWNKWFPVYSKIGFEAFKDEYARNCITLGKQVRIIQDTEELQGIAMDIADNGNLICNINGDSVAIHHGEASIRGLWDYV